MQVPTGPGVRIDTGIYVGFEISTFYDPLISKLIVWGKRALKPLSVCGALSKNIDLLVCERISHSTKI